MELTGPAVPTQVADASLRSKQPSSVCLDAIRLSLIVAGISEDASNLVAKSRQTSTRQTSNNHLQHNVKWCSKEAAHPSFASEAHIDNFCYDCLPPAYRSPSFVKDTYSVSVIGIIHNGFKDGSNYPTEQSLMFLKVCLWKDHLLLVQDLIDILHKLIQAPFEAAED